MSIIRSLPSKSYGASEKIRSKRFRQLLTYKNAFAFTAYAFSQPNCLNVCLIKL